MVEADITVDQIHRAGYHLSRYGDTGDYEIGNCRFITCQENMKEKRVKS
jgi:hypothetical protein